MPRGRRYPGHDARASVSYDLQVWTAAPFEDASKLPDSGWVATHGSRSKSGKGWLINVSANQEVLPEDIPEDVHGALPGMAHA